MRRSLPGIDAFDLGRLPRIAFGPGRFAEVPRIVAGHGRRALVVTGRRSLRAGGGWRRFATGLERERIEAAELTVTGEPSPELVDDAVASFRGAGIEVVVGIGGGSVLDTAKAVAGLLRTGTSVLDHLEGVGRGLPYAGPAVPFVAVPTTAGTGSEATRNAVLSRVGPDGFKKSFRDERLVARDAVVDPDLLAGLPPALIAANGMDALTQLLESYLSSRANPYTDALALSGLDAAREGLPGWFAAAAGDADEPAGRTRMAYAALLSGITLAHAGLGAAHGIASPLGARFPIPHGIACGATIVAATRVNIEALERRAPQAAALERYAEAGRRLADRPGLDAAPARAALVDILVGWTDALDVGGLGRFGVGEGDVPALVADARGSSMRTNPVELTDEEIGEIVLASL